jgi:hypothetical protein
MSWRLNDTANGFMFPLSNIVGIVGAYELGPGNPCATIWTAQIAFVESS